VEKSRIFSIQARRSEGRFFLDQPFVDHAAKVPEQPRADDLCFFALDEADNKLKVGKRGNHYNTELNAIDWGMADWGSVKT
jgi:hypothetical protein